MNVIVPVLGCLFSWGISFWEWVFKSLVFLFNFFTFVNFFNFSNFSYFYSNLFFISFNLLLLKSKQTYSNQNHLSHSTPLHNPAKLYWFVFVDFLSFNSKQTVDSLPKLMHSQSFYHILSRISRLLLIAFSLWRVFYQLSQESSFYNWAIWKKNDLVQLFLQFVWLNSINLSLDK
jgi:hypothetical protein